jgi:hypothetical protein
MLLEAETNKYCPGGYDFGAISNLITWVLNFFLSVDENYRTMFWSIYVRIKILRFHTVTNINSLCTCKIVKYDTCVFCICYIQRLSP